MEHSPISSLAVAGAWGYIGRKFVDAAIELQLATSVYDVGTIPADVDLQGITLFNNEHDFYRQRCDLFHLALHPEHRQTGLDILLQRSLAESICILCEKPMALPESPDDCPAIVRAIEKSRAIVVYDFPELFDPITARVLDFLRGFDQVQIDSIVMQRSKDREDPRIARNQKRMVHIQYQETVHCLAFALYLLAHIHGGLAPVFGDGLIGSATSRPYHPPNPVAYPHVVDGKCEYQLSFGNTRVTGRTDFTRGAPWAKRRTIRGKVDGRPFCVEIDFLEGKKRLEIDDRPQNDVVHTNSYAEVLKTISRMQCEHSVEEIMTGLFPNPGFARIAYQLSSLLWKCCWDSRSIALASLDELLTFDAGFSAAKHRFPKY